MMIRHFFRRCVSFLLFAFLIVCCDHRARAADAEETRYLTDLAAGQMSSDQGWGELGLNTCAHQSGTAALPLQIGNKTYAHGLGHHAAGEISVDLNGLYHRFEATVGVQPIGGSLGSVVFQVFVDDALAFDSGVMRDNSPAKPVSVPLNAAKELRLVVTDAGDGYVSDCANWADARLIAPAGVVFKPTEFRPLEIGASAALVTSVPSRMNGAQAARTQEYRAEDVFLEWPIDLPADGVVPAAADGRRCIGLNWMERRPLAQVGMVFKDRSAIPSPEGAQVQVWPRSTAWQGEWKPLAGTITSTADGWQLAIDRASNPGLNDGIRKVRWIIPASINAGIERLTATSATPTKVAAFNIETEAASDVSAPLTLGIYNGEFLNGTGDDATAATAPALATKGTTSVAVRYARVSQRWADRTLLRFAAADGTGFSVAIADVLKHGQVYVRDYGVFVSLKSSNLTLASYKEQIAGRQTILQQVRAHPDQTVAAAMEKVHHPVQNTQPILLSLACDNNKFIVSRDGSIEPRVVFQNDGIDLASNTSPRGSRMSVTFGSGASAERTRHLDGAWLPAPVMTCSEAGVNYRERVMAVPASDVSPDSQGWLSDKPVCIAEFEMSSAGEQPAEAKLALSFLGDVAGNTPATTRAVPQGIAIESAGKLLALVELPKGIAVESKDNIVTLRGTVRAGALATCRVVFPGFIAKPEALAGVVPDAFAVLKTYWERVLAPGTQIEIPDEFLSNVIRASEVHCLLAARNEDGGKRFAPWIGSVHYGPLETEAHAIIRGMDMLGYDEFARRSFDYFISKYNADGYLTTGYTLMGNGQHLQTLAEHFERVQDRDWLASVAPKVSRVTKWIHDQRQKTTTGPSETVQRTNIFGLAPPGVMADWENYAPYFCLNGYYAAGEREAAKALKAIGAPGADALLKDATSYAEQIRRAYVRTQAMTPVYPLRDGTWVPAYPSQVDGPAPSAMLFPGEDGSRSFAYDVELGAHHLVPQGVIDAKDRNVGWMMDHMEDVQFLVNGFGDYPAGENEKDTFSFGGFGKLQPYYCRNAEISAMRDDVRPFIRSYFNAMASLINTEVLSFEEHFHLIGAWNKTHETGYFLQQTRMMLVDERPGDALWLAPMVSNNWLKDGMQIRVAYAPTRFGAVSYQFKSSAAAGRIDAVIETPTRTTPAEIVIRLRAPDGRPIARVEVAGRPDATFNADDSTVHIPHPKGQMRVAAFMK
jgi:hypothetical protein